MSAVERLALFLSAILVGGLSGLAIAVFLTWLGIGVL